MRSEKITINLSTVELAQIDFLVEKGLYSSRSDFIRLATRKLTEEHKKEIEQFVEPADNNNVSVTSEAFGSGFLVWGLGIVSIDQQTIEDVIRAGKKINIRLIGSLVIEKDVDPEQFKQVLNHIKVYGKITAEPEVKKVIEDFISKKKE